MSHYEEDDYLQLSGIQHFAFCRRQWALIHIEKQWNENVRTIEGKQMHDKAHDAFLNEKRKNILISRAMPVHSRVMGVSGECDIVEFHESSKGVTLFGYEKKYITIPVEYKRGIPKITDIDRLQLTAQALCLEEMLTCEVQTGYLYYGETKRREKVEITDELRDKAKAMFLEMHHLYEKRYTPNVKWSKSCNACSLKDVCLPILGKKDAKGYIDKKVMEDV